MNVRETRLAMQDPGRGQPPSGWQQAFGLVVIGVATTVITVATGSAETAVVAVAPLLAMVPR